MRFLKNFSDESKAFACSNFLNELNIEAIYEFTERQGEGIYSVWVIDEDDFESAQENLVKFEALSSEELQKIEKPKPVAPAAKVVKMGNPTVHLRYSKKIFAARGGYPLTYLLIALCVILFLWNAVQESQMVKEEGAVALQVGLTPLQRDLVFDYPNCFDSLQRLLHEYPLKSLEEMPLLPAEAQAKFAVAEQCSYWKGAFDIFFEKLKDGKKESYTAAPLFEKIRQGEVWRVFTPCLLHRDFLHILFNMSWLFVLGRMIEDRTGKWRMTALILVIGIISNVAQYLMSGPYFLGFSGVVCGMVGFIWMRQRMSPWEGYPLSSGTTLFLVLFVLAMVILQMVSLGLQLFGIEGIVSNIANTAHIVGGLTGLFLARISIFSRSPT